MKRLHLIHFVFFTVLMNLLIIPVIFYFKHLILIAYTILATANFVLYFLFLLYFFVSFERRKDRLGHSFLFVLITTLPIISLFLLKVSVIFTSDFL